MCMPIFKNSHAFTTLNNCNDYCVFYTIDLIITTIVIINK